MLPPPALQQALQGVALIPLRGPWYRAVIYESLVGRAPGAPPGARVQPLWSGGAARGGARFTPKATAGGAGGGAAAIQSLYLAEDERTPLMQIAGVLRPLGSPVPLLFPPQVMMTVDGVLTDVLDVTDVAVQRLLGTFQQELTGEWVVQQATYLAGRTPMPPTQLLGVEALGSGRIVGLRYPSSKNPSGVGVVVFPTRLVASRQTLTVFNPAPGRLQQSLP